MRFDLGSSGEAATGAATETRMEWWYSPEWAGWWLLKTTGGVSGRRGFGPFNATEAAWAAEVHGVPFPPPGTVQTPQAETEPKGGA